VTIEIEHLDPPPVAVVRVRGELDFGTTPRFVEALAGVPAPGGHVIFELSELLFCDSSGLGALIATYKATTAGGGRMYVTGATSTVLTAIQVTTLDRLFILCDSVDAALEDARAN
jgi:anti-sigma B factor antagonist